MFVWHDLVWPVVKIDVRILSSSRWTTHGRDKNLNRPRIRTDITGGPNLQITGLAFIRNSLLQKVSLEPGHTPGNTVHVAVHREWCMRTAQPCGMHCLALTAVHLE